jgi:hypothetical protein
VETAKLFPLTTDLPLLAGTASSRTPIIVTPSADLDLAVVDAS